MDKINQKSLTENVSHVGAALIGAAGSGALLPFVPAKYKKHVQAALLIGAIAVGAASQTGNKKIKPTTSAMLGIALRSGTDLLQDQLKTKFAITDASSPGQKAIAGALGLACPGGCQGSYHSTLPALNMPVYDTVYEELESATGNSFA